MPNLREASASLGCDRRTLLKWLRYADIAPTRNELDRRHKMLGADTVETLRRRFVTPRHVPRAQVVAAAAPAPTDDATQAAILAALEAISRRLEAVERGRAPVPVVVASPPAVARPRARAALEAGDGHRRALPAGWISASTWCQHHSLDRRDLDRRVSEGRMPAPTPPSEGVTWARGVLAAYSPAQHAEASAAAQRARDAGEPWARGFRRCPACAREMG